MEIIAISIAEKTQWADPGTQRSLREMMPFVHPVLDLRENHWQPSLDVFEGPEEVLVLVEIAGVRKEEITVELARQTVRIRGYRRKGALTTEGRYHRAEIAYGGFERAVTLAVPLDAEGVTAHYADGLLTIRIRKRLPAPKRLIPVTRG